MRSEPFETSYQELAATWPPSEIIEQAILSEVNLSGKDSLFMIYDQLTDDSPERKQTTQPFGLLMTLDD